MALTTLPDSRQLGQNRGHEQKFLNHLCFPNFRLFAVTFHSFSTKSIRLTNQCNENKSIHKILSENE